MKSKITDLILLSLNTIALNFTHITPVLFPYILSLIHFKNPSFTLADLFSSNLTYYGGKTLGTYMINKLILRIGFKLLMIVAGISFYISI